jgi:hypothetical protein
LKDLPFYYHCVKTVIDRKEGEEERH